MISGNHLALLEFLFLLLESSYIVFDIINTCNFYFQVDILFAIIVIIIWYYRLEFTWQPDCTRIHIWRYLINSFAFFLAFIVMINTHSTRGVYKHRDSNLL